MLSHVDCDRVQDAYCFRCSPQVHGPVIDLLREVRRVLEIEINSATDNPLVFVDDDGSAEIISGGNFHGQNLSLASDSIAIACHELASISERRINQLMDPNWSGQNAFLAKNEGLESGLMIVQYVAAAVIAELHLLANPASTSNVPVSMGKEDHVSMGATGTFRALQSSILLSQVLANELVCSTEALDAITEAPGAGVAKVSEWVRKHVDGLDGDRSLTNECENLSMAILDGGLTSIFG
jgi:histidine ammonia-lyase